MATRTINSPGVEIREKDLSLTAPPNVGTNIFVTGFAGSGPLDEVIKITTREELDLVYGPPSNSAERYFYYTVNELLNSPCNIYTTRLAYGSGGGVGFGSKYSALVYPVNFVTDVIGADLTHSTKTIGAYALSAASITLLTPNGTTKTIGFSSITYPSTFAVSSVDAFAFYPAGTLTPDVSAVYSALSSALTSAYGTNSGITFGSDYTDLSAQSFSIALTAGSTTLNGFTNSPFNFNFNHRNVSTSLDTSLSSLSGIGGTYVLGEPTHVELNDTDYFAILDGSAFEWSATGGGKDSFTQLSDLAKAGVIILNNAQTTINDQYEGYYVGILDNSNINPGTPYDGIRSVKTFNDTAVYTRANYITIPSSTLQFNLTSNYYLGSSDSVSIQMENLTNYDINTRADDDLLSVGVFKLRKSIFAQEAFKLDYVLEDAIVGSVDYYRTQLNPRGGPNLPYFLEARDSKSRNATILVNDFISNRLQPAGSNVTGIPRKKIRVLAQQLLTIDESITSLTRANITQLSSSLGFGDSLYGLGAYTNVSFKDKSLGQISQKVRRALDGVRNDDIYDIDVVLEAGLGTIAVAKAAYAIDNASTPNIDNYDEYNYNTTLKAYMESLRTSNALNATGETVRALYHDIFNTFESFCSPPYDGGGRGDCIFIADTLRHICVTGKDTKVLSDKVNRNFQKDIYWAIRHQFELANTSYATVYANWCKIYDSYSGRFVWVPFSGFAGSTIANSEASTYPWIAPAGFTRGLISSSNDIAINPNQKQRDELYKSNINPVAFFPSQGQVVFGQKTLLKRPSAFDRINVRRLFLALERPTKKASQFFVFEPNTTFTRTRIINTLTPIFQKAKATEGLYDFLIVCDERNNTPEVIDNNELVVDIYIKPVRSAEFILVNFYATRTDANFTEIIGA